MKRSLMFALVLTLAGAASVRVSACDTTCPAGNHWEWNDSKQTTGHCVADPSSGNQSQQQNQQQNQSQNQGQQQTANGGSAQSSSVSAGGSASLVDNSKTTNTNTALGGAGGSVKDSGNSSSTVKDSGNSSIKNSGNSSSDSSVKNSGNSSSDSSVKNSGNSKNVNVTSSQGGAGGEASSSSVSGSSSAGSGNTTTISSNEEVKIPHQTASAIAPDVYPSAACFKGFGAAAQSGFFGASFGAGKIDQDCSARENARLFAAIGSRFAACKQLTETKQAKAAGISISDCMVEEPKPVAVLPAPALAPVITMPVTVVPASVPVAAVVPERRMIVRDFGSCAVTQINACKKLIDDGHLALNANGSAVLAILGPVEAVKLMAYAKERGVSADRINLKVEDVSAISVSVTSEE